MAQEILNNNDEKLRQISLGQGNYRDLGQCLKIIRHMIIIPLSVGSIHAQEGQNQNLRGDSSLKTQYGGFSEIQPLGITYAEGNFHPHVFTDSSIARSYALTNKFIREADNLPMIEQGWAEGLEIFLVRGYGGFILDDGSDHRIAINRSVMAQIYAQLTLEKFIKIPSCYLLIYRGNPCIQTRGNNQKIAFCFDSESSAGMGIDWLHQNTTGAAEDFSTLEITLEELIQKIISLGTTILVVNKGLPDERPYYRQDLKMMGETIAGSGLKPLQPGISGDAGPGEKIAQPAIEILPADIVLIPEHEGTFVEMWSKLVSIPHLYIPVGTGEKPGTQSFGEDEALQRIDSFILKLPDGKRIGLVYTDERILKPVVIRAEIGTSRILNRFFHEQKVNGVGFNYSSAPQSPEIVVENRSFHDLVHHVPYHFIASKPLIPRIIGMLNSDDPFAASAKSHAELASENLADDRVFEAYHHAALAIEAGEPVDNYFFVALDALFSLNLNQQIEESLELHKEKGLDPRYQCYWARYLALSGQTDQALAILKPLLDDPMCGALAWLEWGRALVIKKQPRPAMNAFSESLYRDPENVGALLGYGIACRSIHVEHYNETGLMSALKTFEKVAQKKGYHVPEALFHMGTIYIALEKWRDAEFVTRKSLALRETGPAKRNLVIALYEQGRNDDARAEYLRLLQKYPEETAGLEEIFS